ncbi:hypothetical protein E1B28_003365 [Marasmius oreades]|uniref:Uncharacterized protein n=1 Tax=Marasmius oreades TaxID=181124 RepID=A0A9P7RLT3_9AGAR|nr:uncharacterized protein E1B28_003365 [Marasmius oreades]KAG7085827.1 hypothetical protein E1B28_003365 [Marasmius oreades]
METQTQQARCCAFDRSAKELEKFGDRMHDCYGITVVAAMSSQSVSDDRSLMYLYDRDGSLRTAVMGAIRSLQN